MISTQVGEMMSLLVVAIWCLIAYGLFLLMRNIYHVFLEAVDPEQKAHASLRRRGLAVGLQRGEAAVIVIIWVGVIARAVTVAVCGFARIEGESVYAVRHAVVVIIII